MQFPSPPSTSAVLRVLLLLLTVLPATLAAQPVRTATPAKGMVISQSTRIAPGVYRLAAGESLDSAVIVIRGNDITVDFTGVELHGTAADAAPDEGRGLAVSIDGGRNVRVRGLRARGYKVAIMARGTNQLVLEGNDLSHNWKPRLFSLVEHESLVDWLSFHRNEQREWLRFGAGIYLDSVTGGTIRRNTVEQGMNGLLMHRTDSLRIIDNDFSYNSALGIGMYRSSHNVITGNRVEFDVRGYSQGFYRRGQDSAGILLYEQSSHNIVAGNSVTHGGDGLFLWAGQSTMDSGKGGANDNLFYDNDFSFAPTNGMEATFSRNDFIANRIEGSDHGLWGGYSFESRVIGNCFVRNRIGIAIEHGQENAIAGNRFDGDTTAIRLWANPIEPSDWGYPKHRDTKSRDYRIAHNAFSGNRDVMRIEQTTGLDTTGNTVHADMRTGCQTGGSNVPQDVRDRLPSDVMPRPRTNDALRDRSAIVVDEWGPFDWRSPKLWPVDSTRATPLRLRVIGPAGNWRVVSERGVSAISARSGRVGDTITVTPSAGASAMDWNIEMEYRGEATVSPTGVRRAAGTPYRFAYARFEPRMTWQVRFFAWADSTDPRSKADAFAALLTGTPLLQRTESRLDYMWYRPTITGLPQSKFATEAMTTVTLPAGVHTLRTISDDAIRVWVNDSLVIDHWTPHESALAYATLPGGTHRIRVQHVQVEGWTELRVEFLRGNIRRSMGSDGPH